MLDVCAWSPPPCTGHLAQLVRAAQLYMVRATLLGVSHWFKSNSGLYCLDVIAH